ncbi:Cation/H(+) antiporter 15 [Sesamum alatum]|uniref:Cation/H(+) antiporter 15 n=1 Tax=Sesamum alatum TaxID=300844 RepID=A0AAE1Y339_9LAMI|nr:Cation/H(+) antiporter 15 [Sesamum alatum]
MSATIATNKSRDSIVCYCPTMITTNGIWQGEDPLDFSLPLFILQVTLIIVTTRILIFILKPFRQPRVIAEILGGVILGPSCLGRSTEFSITIFPLRSVMVLETMANIGLLYFLFLVGVEMDIVHVIKSSGKKAVVIAATGMILPFLIGVSFSFILHQSAQVVKLGTFIIFLGVALSVTAFPVLARILAELKLVNTEIGRIAMASALLNDMCAWVLLAVALAIAENEYWSLSSLFVMETPEGEAINEFYICLILSGVMVSGFITDAIGTHSVFGAFVFGLVIPNGPWPKDRRYIDNGAGTWATLALVIVLASAGKVTGTLLVSLYYDIPFYEGLTLGLLMNTKGLV